MSPRASAQASLCRHWQQVCLPYLSNQHHARKGSHAAMTSGITQITAVSDGEDTAQRPASERTYGLAVLRDSEAKALISLGMDAVGEAHRVSHDLHTAIYDRNNNTPGAELQDQLAEVLTCMETAEHYLLMLGSVFSERPPTDRPETGL